MSNKIYASGFYNEEQKARFLEPLTESTRVSYSRVLSRAKYIEEPLGKDLYNFNQEEIELLIRYMNPKTLESVQHSVNIIQLYMRWAIEEDLRSNNINPLDGLTGKEYFKKFVDSTAKLLFRDDEVYEIIDRLINFQDKAAVLSLYEGIGGKQFSELIQLRTTDITTGNNGIELTNETGHKRLFEASDRLMNVLLKAAEETEYFKKNGEISSTARSSSTVKLLNSPYVMKPIHTNLKGFDRKVQAHSITRKYRTIAELFDMPYFTPINVRNSGMLKMARDIYFSTGELTTNDYKEICSKYGVGTQNKWNQGHLFLRRNFLNIDKIVELFGEKKDV